MRRVLLSAVALAAVSLSSAVVASDYPAPDGAPAYRTAMVDGNPVRVSFVRAELTQDQVFAINGIKRRLEHQVPQTREPLRFEGGRADLTAIPDARDVGRGDCKTYAVAMRNMIADELGIDRDAMLLAGALTERGEPHMVLLIQAVRDGRAVTYAYDVRMDGIVSAASLTTNGYRWLFRESAAGGIPIVFNGDDLLHDPENDHLRAQVRHLRR